MPDETAQFESAFKKLHSAAKRAYAGDDWSITFNKYGVTINDGMDDLVEEADPEEAAEALSDSLEEE